MPFGRIIALQGITEPYEILSRLATSS